MSINITDKPEMNVVNVGDELTIDQLAAIQNATGASGFNPLATIYDLSLISNQPTEAVIGDNGFIVDGQTIVSIVSNGTDCYVNLNLSTRSLGLTITIINTGDGIAVIQDPNGPPWQKFIKETQTFATADFQLMIPPFATRTISWRTTKNGIENYQGLMWFVS